VRAGLIGVGIAAVAGCQTAADDVCSPPPELAIQIDLTVPYDVGTQGVVIHWSDQDPAAGVVGPAGSGVVPLRREFSTRAEAVAFDLPFVVRVAGVERGRASVAFADCDQVSALGHDPDGRRQAVFGYALDFDGNLEGAPRGLRCLATTGPTLDEALARGCAISERRLMYRTRLEGPLAPTFVLVDDVEVPPYAIGVGSQAVELEIHMVSPLDAPVTLVAHDVVIEQAGVASTPYRAGFGTCIRADEDVDPAALVFQREALELVDGVLQLDEWSGYECGTIDGTVFGAIP
jgi:hypothetical protein